MPQENSKTIAIFLASLRGGGAERAMLLFAEGLLELNYKVDLLLAEATGPLINEIPPGVRCIDFKRKRISRALPELIYYLRANRPDALYATVIHANVLSVIASILSRTKIPVIVRESNVPKTAGSGGVSGKISLKLLPWAYSKSKAIIAVSEDVKRELITLKSSLAGKIKVLPTPVISDRIFSLIKEPVNHPWIQDSSIPFVLGIGRLHPQKDFQTLIRAFAEVRKTKPIRLIILGDGKERKSLDTLIVELGLSNDVYLAGFVPNPYPFISAAKVFVLSSRYEGMPNVLIQAMACGTPVISTDCIGGCREVLQDGKLGSLVPVGDYLAMSKSIEEALYMEKRSDSADYVKKRFGVLNSVKQYLALLDQ